MKKQRGFLFGLMMGIIGLMIISAKCNADPISKNYRYWINGQHGVGAEYLDITYTALDGVFPSKNLSINGHLYLQPQQWWTRAQDIYVPLTGIISPRTNSFPTFEANATQQFAYTNSCTAMTRVDIESTNLVIDFVDNSQYCRSITPYAGDSSLQNFSLDFATEYNLESQLDGGILPISYYPPSN